MPIRIRFAEEASIEFAEAVEWYEFHSRGLGLRFTREINSSIERICFDPYANRVVAGTIRKIQVNRFPYSLFYIFEDATLIVLRVYHNKRKPLNW